MQIEDRTSNSSFKIPLIFLAVIWFLFLYQYTMNINLTVLALKPRDSHALLGILFGSLLHGNWEHLIGNTIGLIIGFSFLYFFYSKVANKVLLAAYVFPSIAVFIFGRGELESCTGHIGSSGILYTVIWFLIAIGFFRRTDWVSVLISLIFVILYARTLIGALPGQDGISFEYHFFGLICGVICAAYLKDDVDPYEPLRKLFNKVREIPSKIS